jgi:hypothetical protein
MPIERAVLLDATPNAGASLAEVVRRDARLTRGAA